jgi:hypothetical protein
MKVERGVRRAQHVHKQRVCQTRAQRAEAVLFPGTSYLFFFGDQGISCDAVLNIIILLRRVLGSASIALILYRIKPSELLIPCVSALLDYSISQLA